MKKINKKVLPAIILIIAIMVIGFGMQFFSFKNSGEEIAADQQAAEYAAKVNQCQQDAEKNSELSAECKQILDQK